MIELYQDGATTFDRTTMIGRLSDAIKVRVTQEINGEYELMMTYPMDGVLFDEIKLDRVLRAKPAPGKEMQPFDIYEITRPMNGIVTVYAAHIRYRLALIPVSPFGASNVADALQGLKDNAAEPCPFVFVTSRATMGAYNQLVPDSIMSRLQGEQGSILQVYGGQYEFDNLTVRLHTKLGQDNGVQVRYGKNLVDLTQEESIRNTVTGIYPYWKGFDGEAEAYRELPEKIVYAPNSGSYPYKRTVPLDLSQDWMEEPPTEEQLRARAEKYIRDNNIGIPDVRLEVSFVDLSQTEDYKEMRQLEAVDLGDTVTVIFGRLGVSNKAQISKTVYDGLLDRYESVSIGRVTANLPSVIVQQSIDTEAVKSSTSRAIAGLNASLDQEAVFNRLTDNGRIQGVYMEDGQLYINASYMKTGVLDAELVRVINLEVEKLKSISTDSKKMVHIQGGLFAYGASKDPEIYPYQTVLTMTAGIWSDTDPTGDGTIGRMQVIKATNNNQLVEQTMVSPEEVLVGVKTETQEGMVPTNAEGVIGAGEVYGNKIVYLGGGEDTPDGTIAVGYIRADGTTTMEKGFTLQNVTINGTTYRLLGKVV